MLSVTIRPIFILILISFQVYLTILAEANNTDNKQFALWLIQDANNQTGNNEKLANLLNRVGPNMRASSDYHDYNDINLEESILAWKLLHKQSKHFAQNQVKFYRSNLEKLLNDAEVSIDCKISIDFLLNSLEDLKFWAVQSKWHPQ